MEGSELGVRVDEMYENVGVMGDWSGVVVLRGGGCSWVVCVGCV